MNEKSLKYADLAADAEQRNWKVRVYPVEVGCRGFVGISSIRLLKDLGFQGEVLRQPSKPSATLRSTPWLWLKRRDTIWTPKQQD